jgi:HEPN domain-containing protein
MLPELPPLGSAEDWLRYAVSDLELARMPRAPEIMLEGLCYHAQQCAEKALKAVLTNRCVPAPKTHSVGLLLDLLSEQMAIPSEVEEAAVLTDYAVMCRYPGDAEPVTQQEYEQAVHLAEIVLIWARKVIG